MSDKYKYAPGMPGIGDKGSDGSAGSQGLSMYFTDYNPVTDTTFINLAIQNNYVLWSTQSKRTLPNNRVYVTGDLFVDSDGKIYEINAETNTFVYKFANLNTSGYFISANIASDIYEYNRYFNTNISPKYIIDNVYADGVIPYYNIPSYIYNILPKNYARIEYSNIAEGNYNPFTLYSSGKTSLTDDASALAIVREITTNTFRIGNLDNGGNVRNVKLAFDVSSLRQTKQSTNLFASNTPTGTILTNYEIQANSLFDGAFDKAPPSFTSGYSPTDISIFWVLSDFTSDTDVNADLYFFKNVSTAGQTYSMTTDSSNLRPLVFHNCASSGSISVSNLPTSTTYKYYMSFLKNGWERRSEIFSVVTGDIPNMYISPITTTEASAAHTVGFCVSSNVPWNVLISSNPGSFLSNICASTGLMQLNASLYVDVSFNGTYYPREGTVQAYAINGGGNSPVTGTIIQSGLPPLVEFGINNIQQTSTDSSTTITKRGSVYQKYLPDGTKLNATVDLYITGHGNNISPLGWTFALYDGDSNLLISDSGTIYKNTNYTKTTIAAYTVYGFTNASDLTLHPTLTVDYNDATSDWYTKARVEINGTYVSGPAITSIDLTNNFMCEAVPVDSQHDCPTIVS